MNLRNIPRPVLILVIGGFIQSTGNSLMWPLNSLFMHDILGRTLTEAGTLLALQSGVSLLGQFISGVLADRFGPRKIMLFGLCGAILSVGLIGLFPVWGIYVPGFISFGLSVAFVFVPLNALIHAVWPEGGRRGFNLLYVCNNAGVAVGTALGGLVAQISFRLVFSLNALAFFIYFLIVVFGIREHKTNIHMLPPKNQTQRMTKDKGFKVLVTLGGGIFLVWGAYVQMIAVLPVVMKQLGYSLPAYSILWTLNGIFIVALQPLINWVIRVWGYTFIRQFYLAAALIGLAFIILLGQFPYFSYILVILVLTLGEMLIFPAVPAAAAQLAPKGREGAYQGLIGGTSSGGRMIGPLLGGIVFDQVGDKMVWFLALGFVALSIVFFSLYNRLSQELELSKRELDRNS